MCLGMIASFGCEGGPIKTGRAPSNHLPPRPTGDDSLQKAYAGSGSREEERAMAKKPDKAPKPERRRRDGDRRAPEPCGEMRLVVVIGRESDTDLRGAESWALDRARELGGTTHMWRSYSSGQPMRKFRAADISGGNIVPDANDYGRGHTQANFGLLLPAFQNCKGRISELVIFHHGSPVDEAEVAAELLAVFRAIHVPVCRVVWWACNAEAALQVEQGQWTDSFMRGMGGEARCRPCGCGQLIELIWPTAGKCGINNPGEPTAALTGSGQVRRLRWGYPQPDGSLGLRPPEDGHHHEWNPPNREPPYGQPVPQTGGTVLGAPLAQRNL
jgi:hypothetical protein